MGVGSSKRSSVRLNKIGQQKKVTEPNVKRKKENHLTENTDVHITTSKHSVELPTENGDKRESDGKPVSLSPVPLQKGVVLHRRPRIQSSLSSGSTGRNSRGSRDSRISKRMSFYEIVDASEINAYLMVGNQPSSQDDEFLTRKKIMFVLNLSNSPVQYIKPGVQYKSIPLDDEDDEDLTHHLEECLDFLKACKKTCDETKSRILIYSYFGLSRSCSVALAHLMKEDGWTLEYAWNHLRECNPSAKPNDGFLLQLLEYERVLHGKISMTMTDFYTR